jgi:hypothetical protein
VLAAGICWVVAPLLRVQVLRLEKRNQQRKREVCNDRNLLVEVFDARIQLPLPDFVAVLQYEEYGRKTGRHHQKHIHLLVVERNYVVQKSHAQLQKKSGANFQARCTRGQHSAARTLTFCCWYAELPLVANLTSKMNASDATGSTMRSKSQMTM